VAPTVTQPPPDGDYVTLDVSAPNPDLTPDVRVVLTRPAGDLNVIPFDESSFAIVDSTTDLMDFYDAATGERLRQTTIDVPNPWIAWAAFGPDDVLYSYEGEQEALNPEGLHVVEFVARAPTADGYREVARVPYHVGDGFWGLGETGVYVWERSNVVLPYVNHDGTPSGATREEIPVVQELDRQTLKVSRGTHSWTVYYVGSHCFDPEETMLLCLTGGLPGPGESVVLIDYFSANDPNRPMESKITLLADTITTWDTSWRYVGVVGANLLVTRTLNGRIEVGLIEP
jgi:hypothetical protein